MPKNHIKKQIRFWQGFENTVIAQGAKEIKRRLERAYTRHRAKSTQKNP